MSRILPLADCGVADMPSEDEPPRASLIREIYMFLDHRVSLFSFYVTLEISHEVLPCGNSIEWKFVFTWSQL